MVLATGPVEDAAVRLEASGFDLGRALVSRRTPQQLASWTVTGDVSAYLAGLRAPRTPARGAAPGVSRGVVVPPGKDGTTG